MPLQNIEIRLCALDEIAQVIDINSHWQRSALAGNLSNGFVTGGLDPQYLIEVIERKEIVVALDGTIVVGYYMINDIEHSPTNHSKIKEMIERGYLSTNVRVGLAAQSAILLAYHGKGLALAMLQEIASMIKDNYDIIVTSIDKLNTKNLRRHHNNKNSRWKIYTEDNELVYIYYDLHHEVENHEYFFRKDLVYKSTE